MQLLKSESCVCVDEWVMYSCCIHSFSMVKKQVQTIIWKSYLLTLCVCVLCFFNPCFKDCKVVLITQVGGMFFYNVIQCQCIAYNVVALLAEINTIFLHTRKLLQVRLTVTSLT